MVAASVVSVDEELATQPPGGSTQVPSRQPIPKPSRCTPLRVASALILVGVGVLVATTISGGDGEDTNAGSDFDLFDPSTWLPDWLDKNPHGGDTPLDFNTVSSSTLYLSLFTL